MTREGKTLSYSEQTAFEALLRLVKLEMVPDCSLYAVDMGRVEEQYKDVALGGYWAIKKREIIYEWKSPQPQIDKKIADECKIVLKILLRGEIPLINDKEIQSEKAQRRWWVIGIEIYQIQEKNGKEQMRHPIFNLEGEQNIGFLLFPEHYRKEYF